MDTQTEQAILEHRDQFIDYRWNTFGLSITIMTSNEETIRDVTRIARSAGCTCQKTIVGADTDDPEARLLIRKKR